MSIYDWLITIIPMILLLGIAFYSKKYVKGAADFLVAGRVAGRYVLSVGDMTSGLSVILLVASCEVSYQTGFAISFWWMTISSVSILMALTGFCTYRWRETRCLSMGEFLELRYGSKFFRIFCAFLRTVAELGANAIAPAIATNFFIHYLDLPRSFMVCGVNISTYILVVIVCVILALLFIWPSGRISLLLTDSIQGILCYPIFVIIVGYVLIKFSWWDEISPVLANRVEGESFLNPFDIEKMRDFNLFAIIVSVVGAIVNRAQWIGNDTSGVAKTPHEQKMAGVLGAWRNGFSTIMILVLTVIVIAFLNNPKFMKDNKFNVSSIKIRQELSAKVLDETVPSETDKKEIMGKIYAMSEAEMNADIPLSQAKNMDTPYYEKAYEVLGDTPQGRLQYQKFRSVFQQMLMPAVLSNIFPVGLVGLFCLLAVMLLVSTDDSRIFNSSSTLMQDVLLPFFKHRLTPKLHILLLRLTAVAVGLIFILISIFFAQLDYISMFTTIIIAIWGGGAGPIMLFGLYSRFGNIYGAWSAIFFGSGTSLLGLFLQRNWAETVYPFLERHDWVEPLNNFLVAVSKPFNPWIVWEMDAVKFPINSFEIYFISMALSIIGYILVSYITYKPFNLDKLLHRGKYADENSSQPPSWNFRTILSSLVGITPECTKSDRIISWSVFIYSIIYGLGICFFGVMIWNFISPWPIEWWTIQFYLTMLIIPGIIGVISTVWFFWGGIVDTGKLFKDLAKRKTDENDNGQILD